MQVDEESTTTSHDLFVDWGQDDKSTSTVTMSVSTQTFETKFNDMFPQEPPPSSYASSVRGPPDLLPPGMTPAPKLTDKQITDCVLHHTVPAALAAISTSGPGLANKSNPNTVEEVLSVTVMPNQAEKQRIDGVLVDTGTKVIKLSIDVQTASPIATLSPTLLDPGLGVGTCMEDEHESRSRYLPFRGQATPPALQH
jgi:hypothetical protein